MLMILIRVGIVDGLAGHGSLVRVGALAAEIAFLEVVPCIILSATLVHIEITTRRPATIVPISMPPGDASEFQMVLSVAG
jgi:hypothetical protein